MLTYLFLREFIIIATPERGLVLTLLLIRNLIISVMSEWGLVNFINVLINSFTIVVLVLRACIIIYRDLGDRFIYTTVKLIIVHCWFCHDHAYTFITHFNGNWYYYGNLDSMQKKMNHFIKHLSREMCHQGWFMILWLIYELRTDVTRNTPLIKYKTVAESNIEDN